MNEPEGKRDGSAFLLTGTGAYLAVLTMESHRGNFPALRANGASLSCLGGDTKL